MKFLLILGLFVLGSFGDEGTEKKVDCQGGFENIDGKCSAECGCGVIKQHYVIKQEAENGGEPCEHKAGTYYAVPCKIRDCPEIFWKPCNSTCGPGFEEAYWEDPNEPMALPYPTVRECENPACCKVSDWTDWEGCPACGEGTETRTRSVLVDGYGCEDQELVEEQPCKLKECPFLMEVVPNTTCSGEQLNLTVENPSSISCMRACEQSSDCKAMTFSDGDCTFFSEVEDDAYTPGVADCFIKKEEWDFMSLLSWEKAAYFFTCVAGFAAVVLIFNSVSDTGLSAVPYSPEQKVRPRREAIDHTVTPPNRRST